MALPLRPKARSTKLEGAHPAGPGLEARGSRPPGNPGENLPRDGGVPEQGKTILGLTRPAAGHACAGPAGAAPRSVSSVRRGRADRRRRAERRRQDDALCGRSSPRPTRRGAASGPQAARSWPARVVVGKNTRPRASIERAPSSTTTSRSSTTSAARGRAPSSTSGSSMESMDLRATRPLPLRRAKQRREGSARCRGGARRPGEGAARGANLLISWSGPAPTTSTCRRSPPWRTCSRPKAR